MKGTYTVICLLCCFYSFAQLPAHSFGGTRKFSDIVLEYENLAGIKGHLSNSQRTMWHALGLNENEEESFQFDRWKWYWQQHLDQNGFIVPPIKNFREWQKAFKQTARKGADKTTLTSSAAWSFVGPDSSDTDGNGVGRITLVAFHPSNASTYLVGSPGGGVWRTSDNGSHWTCLTDQMPLLSISDIKYNPLNPNTIYICTGDKDGDDYWSIGVFKSTNGGDTWTSTGMVFGDSTLNLCNSILINPLDTNTLILGTTLGIYISHDAGTSWTLTYGGYNFKQLLYHPTDTNVIYATSHYSDTQAAQVFRSADGGTTWSMVTSFSGTYRISLAVTPANVAIVEGVCSATDYGLKNIIRSTDTGNTFAQVYDGSCGSGNSNLLAFNPDGSGCGGQGFYDLSIAIDPANENFVYVGGVNSWMSSDGGVSWSILNQWSNFIFGTPVVHADKHFMGFHPLVSGRFFECNDGGVYYIDNPSFGIWENVTNHLGVEEIYRVAVSNVATYEWSGAQDDGTKQTQNGSFIQVMGGDGMQCVLDPQDSNIAYASSEYGNIDYYDSVEVLNINGNIPGTPTGGWITPYMIMPSDHQSLLAGYQQVWESNDKGASWYSVSPILTSYSLLRVVNSVSDANTAYAAEDGTNNIFYCSNLSAAGSATWTTLAPTAYPGAINSDLKIDLFDNTKFWVTYSGYGGPQVLSYSPADGWTQHNEGLPDVPVNCIMIDTSTAVKYLGTDLGVYYRDTAMTSWMPYNSGMPVVRVNDLQINYATGKIWAATYGRSLWVSPKQPAHPEVTPIYPLVGDYLSFSPNPTQNLVTINFGSQLSEQEVLIKLIDCTGRPLISKRLPVVNQLVKLDVSGCSAGQYIVEVNGETGIIGRNKLIITK